MTDPRQINGELVDISVQLGGGGGGTGQDF